MTEGAELNQAGIDPKHRRYVPRGAERQDCGISGVAVYFYPHSKTGEPCVTIFSGQNAKPILHRYYKTAERRDEAVASALGEIARKLERTQARRTDANRPHRWDKGLILCASWGYDQTNVQFWEIVEVPSPCYVVLQEIAAVRVSSGEQAMSGHAFPDPEIGVGRPFRAKVNMADNIGRVAIRSFISAAPWDGREMPCSWYA